MQSLSEMLSAMNQEQEPEQPGFPLPEAQREEMEAIRAQIGETPRTFKRWDEVHFAHRCGSFIPEVEKNAVFVFWTYLTPEQVNFRLTLAQSGSDVYCYAAPDCLIMHVSPTLGVRFDIADSSLLVPALP